MGVDRNNLYPVFFRLDRLKMLIVGAGEVGMEKLSFILKSSPNAQITIVATWIGEEVEALATQYPDSVKISKKAFEASDVAGHDLIVAATNFKEINQSVYDAAKAHDKIVNIADTPSLCDFYMGSIVTRGDLKIAISTNGKSPTFSKRMRQVLEDILPDETNALLENLKLYRDQLKGNFETKVKELNEITKTLVER